MVGTWGSHHSLGSGAVCCDRKREGPKVLPHVVRSHPSQGLLELHMVLPAPDTDEKNGLNLLRRLWVVKFDKEEEIRKLAER